MSTDTNDVSGHARREMPKWRLKRRKMEKFILTNFLSQKNIWHGGSLYVEISIYSILVFIVFAINPGGFFNIDEAIYFIGAKSLSSLGQVGIGNGYDFFHSDALKLWFLVDGPQGLTPQYPIGSAALGAIAFPFLGAKALMLANTLAAIALLPVVARIGTLHFGCAATTRVALALLVLGTFLLEYAVGIWPHALALLCSTCAYLFAVQHIEGRGTPAVHAMLAGFCTGAGMLFRLDAAFAIPAVGLIFLVFAPNILKSLFFFGLGIVPPLAVLSLTNDLKFGTFNPFSYGHSGGNTDLTAYGPMALGLVATIFGLLLLRKLRWKVDRKLIAICILLATVVILAVPVVGAMLLKIGHSFLALIVDARFIQDSRPGITIGKGGVVIFWGVAKKALGQSLPWIGILSSLIVGRQPEEDRRVTWMMLIFIATTMAPFVLLAWHGGFGNNMRYFLPAVPLLCVLCARLIVELWRMVPDARTIFVRGIWATLLLSLAWVTLLPSGYGGVQQILSSYVLAVLTVSSLAAGFSWRFQHLARVSTIFLLGCAISLSSAFAYTDLIGARATRQGSVEINKALSEIPKHSLVIASAEWVVATIPGNDSFVAMRGRLDDAVDLELVDRALRSGLRVFIVSKGFDAIKDVPLDARSIPSNIRYPGGRMIEIRLRGNHSPPKRETHTFQRGSVANSSHGPYVIERAG